MANTVIKMPQLGESVSEGTIGRWLKQPGERVERGPEDRRLCPDELQVLVERLGARFNQAVELLEKRIATTGRECARQVGPAQDGHPQQEFADVAGDRNPQPERGQGDGEPEENGADDPSGPPHPVVWMGCELRVRGVGVDGLAGDRGVTHQLLTTHLLPQPHTHPVRSQTG